MATVTSPSGRKLSSTSRTVAVNSGFFSRTRAWNIALSSMAPAAARTGADSASRRARVADRLPPPSAHLLLQHLHQLDAGIAQALRQQLRELHQQLGADVRARADQAFHRGPIEHRRLHLAQRPAARVA